MDRKLKNSVLIKYNAANEIMVIVRELRKSGLIDGEDFEFAIEHYGFARFYFKHAERATFYRLKFA